MGSQTASRNCLCAVPPVPEMPRLLNADVQIPQAQLGSRLRVCSYNVLAEVSFARHFIYFFVAPINMFLHNVTARRFIQASRSIRIALCGPYLGIFGTKILCVR